MRFVRGGLNMRDKIEVNGRSYLWPKVPLVVVCIDGSEPDYIERAVENGLMPFTETILSLSLIHISEPTRPY